MTDTSKNIGKNKFLVTGGAGFIGFHLCRKLLDSGNEVIIVDNLSEYYDVNLKKDRLKQIPEAKLYVGDVSDYTFMTNVLKENKIKMIIHLAAQAGVRYSLENPFYYEKSNNLGTLTIFEIAKKFGIEDVVYASSSSVYGGNTKVPFSVEDNVDNPVSTYAATKKYNELVAHAYYNLYNIRSTGLRFFTVYGPWGRPDMAIFKFTKAILADENIDLYNNGDHIRDFTYIDDIVTGILSAMEKNSACSIYNLGNNKPVKLRELVALIEMNLKKSSNKNYLPMQKGDVHATFADIELTTKELNWEPKTDLREGLKEFMNWYKEYHPNFK